MRTRVPLLSPAFAASALLAAIVATGGATPAGAQTSLVPYFGKNNIHYDKFKWMIYTTDHFEIYYYPEIEQHLERVAGYAESFKPIPHPIIPRRFWRSRRKSISSDREANGPSGRISSSSICCRRRLPRTKS